MSVWVVASAIAVLALLTGLLFYYNLTVGIVALACSSLVAVMAIKAYSDRKKYLKDQVEKINLYFSTQGGRQTYPMPVLVADNKGLILWYNRLFEEIMVPNGTLPKDQLSQYLGKVSAKEIAGKQEGYNLHLQDRQYTVYASRIDREEEDPSYALFFFDNTELKEAAEKYNQSKPVVIKIRIDNLDEVYKNFKNSECEVISGEIETLLDDWAAQFPCLFRRISGGGYIMVTEECSLQVMMDHQFEILNRVHDYRYKDKPLSISLSMGIGRGLNLSQNDQLSKQALEISQSRGGDQVTVNTDGQLTFFGGTVVSTASSSQVKARMMATTIADHIKAVDVVFASGHAFSDLDSIGACVGVWEMAKALGKPCYILCDKSKSMAKSLLHRLEDSPLHDCFIDRTAALNLMRGKTTLLVVVDTHRMDSLEYPELTDGFDRIAIVDHHRRVAHAIENVVLFYDEPSASSACEMVTELIQYLPVVIDLESSSAEALLSGIMLDTRCFVLSTGTRTFQAAAFLKSHGADTVAVKQMFSSSLEAYREKAKILSNTETYESCAIAVVPDQDQQEIRAIASQVADELMNVTGMKSSYVLFQDNGCINISARSLGEMNVQILMEKLGGGGHFTMAATQLYNTTMTEAVDQLKQVIHNYPERV